MKKTPFISALILVWFAFISLAPLTPQGGGGGVTSVNGQTGVVTLTKSDIGLGNVANPPAAIACTTVDVTTDSTVVPVSQLNFAASANTSYIVTYYMLVTSDGQAVLRIKPSYPTGIVSAYTGLAGSQDSGDAQVSQPPANGTQTAQYISTQAGDFSLMTVYLQVKVGASAGNIVFAFSSHAGTFGTIKAGSCATVMVAQ